MGQRIIFTLKIIIISIYAYCGVDIRHDIKLLFQRKGKFINLKYSYVEANCNHFIMHTRQQTGL